MVKKIALAVSLCTLLSSGAFAASNAFEITPMIGANFTSADRLKKDPSLAIGLKVGGRLAYNWLVEAGYENAGKIKYDTRRQRHTSFDRIYSNIVYEFVDTTTSPYFLAGVGGESVSNPLFGVKGGLFAQVGAGLRYEVSDSVHLKAELRDIIGNNRNEIVAMLGLTIPFSIGKYEAPIRTSYKTPQEETRQEQAQIQEQKQERFIAAKEPRQEIQEPVQEIAKEPTKTKERFVQSPQQKEARQDMVERSRQAERENTTKGVASIIKTDALFDFDSSVVKDYYNNKISELANNMKNNPAYKAKISGHTDSIGNEDYNKSLSLRRANAVREMFVGYGVEKKRLKVQGYGSAQPIADNNTKEGRAQNRRVEIEISEN